MDSALAHARILEDLDFHDFKISVKASDMFLAVAAYQQLAEATDAPLHLGITEAGGRRIGTVKSSIGMGNLLWMGIGDTIRVSLSDDPVEEVKVGFDMLKSLGLRSRGVNIIAVRHARARDLMSLRQSRHWKNVWPISVNPLRCLLLVAWSTGPVRPL